MFKNLTILRINGEWNPQASEVEEKLEGARFVNCGQTEMKSQGWVEPRGIKHSPLLESISGHWLLKYMVEKKDLPGSVVKRAVAERAAEIQEREGRKPGRKELGEIKEEVILDLLPKAFTKFSSTLVWIDRDQQLLFIDSTSSKHTDEIVSLLVKTFDGLEITPLQTATSPSTAMSNWLIEGEMEGDFALDGECELKSADEQKATVKYARHRLDIVEVQQHIQQGKVPQMLAACWSERVSFVLNAALQVKKIKFLDGATEGLDRDAENAFDTDATLATGDLSALVKALIEMMGGEMKLGL